MVSIVIIVIIVIMVITVIIVMIVMIDRKACDRVDACATTNVASGPWWHGLP